MHGIQLEKMQKIEKGTVFKWKKANLKKNARYSYVALLSLSLCLVIFHCLFSGQISLLFMDVYCLFSGPFIHFFTFFFTFGVTGTIGDV